MSDDLTDGKPATKAEDIVQEAKKRFERAKSFYATSRELAIADTRFAMGDSDNGWQWPDTVANQRKVDQKVMLTVNMTAQHCNQIINNIRQNRPQARVLPADSGADKKTAEIIGGLIRQIQTASGDDSVDLAAEHAVYGGEGYWRVATEYASPTSFDQVIKRKAIPNPNLVFIDPAARELDKSDAEWGFVFEDISKEQARREHPDIPLSDWSATDKGGWVTEGTVRRAEYFYCTWEKDTAVLYSDGSTGLKSAPVPPGLQIVPVDASGKPAERPTQVKRWKWCKLIGDTQKPVDEEDWPGDYLPIIAVVGKELNVDGQIVRKGIVRDLKDPARMVNYAYSETVQTLALQNKIPYIAAAEAIEGYEENWKNANSANASYLPFNAYDDEGNALPQPKRQEAAVMPAAQIQLLQVSTEQMRAASGQQNANFGIKSEAQSGIGIQRLKVQGETATFHFPDNLRRALQYEAKVELDLIQKIYDTKRVVRILGLDGQEDQATLDPQAQGYSEHETTEQDVERIFNPMVGQYDVVIDTGPSFQTQRQEGAANLTELAAKAPILMQAAPDLIMRSYDFPGAQEIADRLEKTLPPGLSDGKGNAAAQMAQQLQQVGQQAEQMKGVIGKMQEHIDKLEGEKAARVQQGQTQIEIAQIKQKTEAAKGVAQHSVDSFDALTRRLDALVGSMGPDALKPLIVETLRDILSEPDLGPGPDQPDIVAQPVTPPEMAAADAQSGPGDEPVLQ